MVANPRRMKAWAEMPPPASTRGPAIHMARLFCTEPTPRLAADSILVADWRGFRRGIGTGLLYDIQGPAGGHFIPRPRLSPRSAMGSPAGSARRWPAAGKTPVVAISGDAAFNMSLGEPKPRAAAQASD